MEGSRECAPRHVASGSSLKERIPPILYVALRFTTTAFGRAADIFVHAHPRLCQDTTRFAHDDLPLTWATVWFAPLALSGLRNLGDALVGVGDWARAREIEVL